jgi:hypothetical protein
MPPRGKRRIAYGVRGRRGGYRGERAVESPSGLDYEELPVAIETVSVLPSADYSA